jgi:hypothetical protein
VYNLYRITVRHQICYQFIKFYFFNKFSDNYITGHNEKLFEKKLIWSRISIFLVKAYFQGSRTQNLDSSCNSMINLNYATLQDIYVCLNYFKNVIENADFYNNIKIRFFCFVSFLVLMASFCVKCNVQILKLSVNIKKIYSNFFIFIE